MHKNNELKNRVGKLHETLNNRFGGRLRLLRKSDFAAANAVVRSAKGIHLTAAAVMLLSGILLCCISDFDGTAARITMACCCIIIGGADIFGYYSNDMFRLAFQFAFAFGAYSTIYGVMLLLLPERMIDALPYAIGAYVILDGLQKVQIALEARKFGISKWFLILGTSVAVVVLGFVSVLVTTDENAFLWMGISVAANGAENFWTTMYTVRIRT